DPGTVWEKQPGRPKPAPVSRPRPLRSNIGLFPSTAAPANPIKGSASHPSGSGDAPAVTDPPKTAATISAATPATTSAATGVAGAANPTAMGAEAPKSIATA